MLYPEHPYFPFTARWATPEGGRAVLLQEGARQDTAARELLPPRFRTEGSADWLELPGWGPVPAHRVLRDQVQHTVLQGDRMVEGGVMEAEEGSKKRDVRLLIAIVLLVLAIAAAVFLVYNGPSGPAAAGSSWSPSR